MRIYLKDKSKRLFAILLSCLMVVGAILPGMQIFANSKLDLKNVTIKSFDIIDSANGEQKIEYKKQGDEGYDDYLKDPSKFKTVVCQNQKKSNLSLKLEMTYKGTEPIKEGDTLEVPAYIKPFDEATYSAQQLTDNQGNPIGTYEYRNGKFVITFSGDHIKNKKEVSLNLSTPKRTVSNTLYGEGDDIEKTPIYGQLGDKKIIVGYEKKKKSDPKDPGSINLDDIRIKSFKIIDIANGNREIDYRTSDQPDYNNFKNDSSKFSNTLNEGQKLSDVVLELAIEYKGDKPLREGDVLTIPAEIGIYRTSFTEQPLFDGKKNQIGTWEYNDGCVKIKFNGDYIKNNRVTEFTASFRTGVTRYQLSNNGKTTTLGERKTLVGKLGKNELVTSGEKLYVEAQNIGVSYRHITKWASSTTDKKVLWGISIESDVAPKGDKEYFNPYLLENDGKYSPEALSDIYWEDTFVEASGKPRLTSIFTSVTGIDDSGKVISGARNVNIEIGLLKEIQQGSKTKAEIKDALNKGEYCVYNNNDGTYTFMMKWWNMNGGSGPTYDQLPSIKNFGGVGNYLKSVEPEIYSKFSAATIEKINKLYKGKSIQNVRFFIETDYVPIKEKKKFQIRLK